MAAATKQARKRGAFAAWLQSGAPVSSNVEASPRMR